MKNISLAAQLMGSIRTAKKTAAARQNAQKAREALQRKTGGKPFVMRDISRIERAADRLAYEVLQCGHRGKLTEGPQRIYIGNQRRRCYECYDSVRPQNT